MQTQSEHINELAAALSKAQAEIAPAIKDSSNPFFKSKYADLSSIWNACRDPLTKNGLAIMQTMDFQEGQLMLATTLAHASGQWMRSYLPIINEKNNAQGLGSAITYNRRYALSAMVGIIADDDDDANSACASTLVKKQEKTSLTPFDFDHLADVLDKLEQCDPPQAAHMTNYHLKKHNVSSIEELPQEGLKGLADSIQRHLKMKGAA